MQIVLWRVLSSFDHFDSLNGIQQRAHLGGALKQHPAAITVNQSQEAAELNCVAKALFGPDEQGFAGQRLALPLRLLHAGLEHFVMGQIGAVLVSYPSVLKISRFEEGKGSIENDLT